MFKKTSTKNPYKLDVWTVSGYGGTYEFEDEAAYEQFISDVDLGVDRMKAYNLANVKGTLNIRPSMVYCWKAA